jgi:microcystin-dependent protein
MPSHKHSFNAKWNDAAGTGFHEMTIGSSGRQGSSWETVDVTNTGNGGSHNNMQPYIVVNFIIKY